jgi:predicted permease
MTFTTLLQDARYAGRILRRKPGSALVAVLTIALGIGATTILFSVVWNVLRKPLPWPEADRLVRVIETRQGATRRLPPILTNGSYLAWRDSATTIEGIAGWQNRDMTIAAGGDPQRSRVVVMTASAFRLLQAQPAIGSLFSEQDEAAGDVAVISHGLWQRQFAGHPSAVGGKLLLDGRPYTIVGVMPASFVFPDRDARVWVPLRVRPVVDGQSRLISLFNGIARLKPGITPAQAEQEATTAARNGADPGMTAIAVFGSRGASNIAVVPVIDAMTADVRPALIVLLAAVALLLLTATANIASVQLARATSRRREMAVRSALGAGGARLARQMLVESAVVGILGGALGLALAAGAHRLLPSVLPADFPRVSDVTLDWRVLIFAAAVSIVSSIAFGLLPALQAGRVNVVRGLAEDGNAPAGYGRTATGRLRSVIMAGQVAIACVLLIGASLLIRSFNEMMQVDRGYDTSNILTARMPMPDALFTSPRRVDLVSSILARLGARADVTAAAFTTVLPLGTSDALMGFMMPPRRGDGGPPVQAQAAVRTISADYFRAIGMRIGEGRGFTASDTTASQPIVVVNRAFVKKYVDGSALGMRLPLGFQRQHGGDGVQWEIAGVVEDARSRSVLDAPQPEMFVCVCQIASGIQSDPILVVRTNSDPVAFIGTLRETVREHEPTIALDAIMTMDQRLLGSLARPRLYAIVLGWFAAFALAIAAVGLFGVLSYTVAQRSRELSVRTALGARPSDIVRLVLRDGMIVTAAGLAVGLGAAFALARSVSTFLFGIQPHDVLTFAAVPAVLIVVAAIACVVPARRAASVDPLQVLKT